MLQVAEKFVSINGEGAHAGETAVFIRFRGCNLNCTYCDTKWANRKDTPFTEEAPEALACWVKETSCRNVTLTGGEPLLQKDIKQLTDILIDTGCRVEIETNGSISLAELAVAEKRPCFTMDYKLPCSGMESFMDTDNFGLLNDHDTVKFVAGSEEDLIRAKSVMEEYALVGRCHVYISPVFGSIDPAEIVRFMIENKMNGVRLQLQLHKFIWDPDKRGV